MKKALFCLAMAALLLPSALRAQITTFPWNYDFSDSTQSMSDWTFHYLVVTDTNEENTNILDTFYYSYEWIGGNGHDAPGCMYNYLSTGSMMITPALQVPANATNYSLSFWSSNEVLSYYGIYNFPPAYKVLLSTTTNDSAAFTTELLSDNLEHDWEFKTVSLAAYAGQTVYIAFMLTGNGYNFIDDITVGPIDKPVYNVSGPSLAQTGVAQNLSATYLAGDQNGMILTWSSAMASNGQATIANANSQNATITYNAPGTDQITFTASNSHGTFTDTIDVTVFSCDPIATFPWNFDFSTQVPDNCWANHDADGDGYAWRIITLQGSGEVHIASESYASQTALHPDNWLVTPQISLPAEATTFTWEYKTQDPQWPAEHLGVYVSTTGNNPSDFTLIDEYTCVDADSVWHTRSNDLSAYAGQQIYIAIRHFNCSDNFRVALKSLSIAVGTTQGIAEVNNNLISVSPNPASSIVEINTTGIEGNATVAIVDLNGRTLLQQQGSAAAFRFDVSNLPAGAYFVRLTGSNTSAVQKLIVK